MLTTFGVEVDVGELLGHQIKQLGLGQPVDLGVEFEALEDVADRGRKRLHVGEEVFPDMVLVAHQLLHVQGRRVEEVLPGLAQQERLRVEPGLLPGGQFGQHGGLGLLQHAIEPPQHGEWQDHLAIFGLLVVASQQIGHGPDEGGQIVGSNGLPPS